MIPKFRAFCKRHKCIEEVFQITYLGDNDIKVEAECLSGYVGSDFILMQSTGLHDHNGVEVFEGDLIHYTYDGFDWYVPVIYREGRFEVYHGTLSTIPASKIPSGKYATNIGNSIRMYRVEFTDMYVAGNIYENPELLEDV